MMLFMRLLFLSISLTILSRAAEAQNISKSELSLGGVAIGQTETEVVRRLGTPTEIKDTGEGHLFKYPGLEVYIGVESYGVFDIVSKSPAHCTPSKLCPKMSVSDANHLYGAPVVAARDSNTYFEYTPKDSTCWLQVSAPKGIIQSLRIACQP